MKPYYYAAENICQRKWATIEEAQAEAERYAEAHPGKTFEILRCVGIAQTSKASMFWMDGEEPPEKPRYRELEDGEDFQKGDEWQPFPGDEWLKVPYYSLGEIYHKSVYPLPHRRPL